MEPSAPVLPPTIGAHERDDLPEPRAAEPELDADLTAASAEQPVASEPADPLLERLRARRHAIATGDHTLLRDVPGYEGALVVIYRWPAGGLATIRKGSARWRQSKSDDVELMVAASSLVSCTAEVLVQDDAGVRQPIVQGRTVRWDRTLAKALQIDVPETLEERDVPLFVLRSVFSPEAEVTGEWPGDAAILVEAAALDRWLRTRSSEASNEFVEG